MTMLTATTKKFAAARNLDVTVEELEDVVALCIWEAEDDSEWLCSYRVNADGSYSWNGNVYLKPEVKEELPATIRDEKHLREVLAFIAKNI